LTASSANASGDQAITLSGVGELAERSAPSDRHESGEGARLGDEAVTVELR
jgi:hypothetical protein